MRALPRYLSKISGSVRNNFSWMFVAYIVKTILQTIAFIMLARILEASEYGSFVGVLALMTIMASFFDFGAYSNSVLLISKGKEVRNVISICVKLGLIGMIAMLVLLSILKIVFFKENNWIVYYSLLFASIVGDRLQMIFTGISLALNRSHWAAILETCNWIFRIMLVLLLSAIDGRAVDWSVMYVIQSISVGIVGIVFLVNKFKALGNEKLSMEYFRSGIGFSTGAMLKSLSTDLDKVILSKLSNPQSVALYTVAYRFVNILYLPLHALFGSTYQNFFKIGEMGIKFSLRYGFKLLPITLAYSIFTLLLVYFFGKHIGIILGSSYLHIDLAVKFLASIIVIQALHQPIADAFSGGGKQGLRNLLQTIALILSIILNVYLIPRYDWIGAAVSAIFAHILLLVMYFCVSLYFIKESDE